MIGFAPRCGSLTGVSTGRLKPQSKINIAGQVIPFCGPRRVLCCTPAVRPHRYDLEHLGAPSMNRRDLMKMGAAGITASMLDGYVAYAAEQKTYRVGLIGCGWYGKNDLFRLIQVSPVEVVSLCDVDQHMLAETVQTVTARQVSRKSPRTYRDYREMLKEKDLNIVL